MADQPEVKHDTALDSDQQQVGQLYAKALLGAAGSDVDSVVAQLETVVKECLDRFPMLEQALASPRISQDKKEEMLGRVLSGRVDKMLLNFLKVLCRRGRIGSLRAIQVTATEIRDEQLGKMRVQVTSAMPLTAEQKQQISARLKTTFDKEAVLIEKVDPRLLGGIVLRIGDRVFDGSVQGRMEQMRQAVTAGVQRSLRDRYDSLISS